MGNVFPSLSIRRRRTFPEPVFLLKPRSEDMRAVVEAELAAKGGMLIELHMDIRRLKSAMHKLHSEFQKMMRDFE